MTIQQYSNKIINLGVEGGHHLTDDNDLEKTASKIFMDNSKTYFTLKDLFEESVETVTLKSKTVTLFSDRLGLLFSSEKEPGNVCFANSSELRQEFRQSFIAIELLDYVYAFSHASFYKESQKIAITSGIDIFWKLVKIGSHWRK